MTSSRTAVTGRTAAAGRVPASGRVASARTVSPKDLAGLVAWWAAEFGRFDAGTPTGAPVVADAGAVGRWVTKLGKSAAVMTTAASRPGYDAAAGRIVPDVGTTGSTHKYFNLTGAPTLNRRAFSVFGIGDVSTVRRGNTSTGVKQYHMFVRGTGDGLNLFYDGTGTVAGRLGTYDGATLRYSTSIPTTSRCLFGWVGDAAEIRHYVNGGYTTTAPAQAGSVVPLNLFSNSVVQQPWQGGVTDVLVFDRALSDAEVAGTLLPYARARGVTDTVTANVVCVGDSITAGVCTTLNRGWVQLMGLGATVRVTGTAESAVTIGRNTPSLSSTTADVEAALVVPGVRNVAVVFAGTNDIFFGDTGAQAFARLVAFCTTLRAQGYTQLVVVTMLPRTGLETERQAFNGAIRTAVAPPWDAAADVETVAAIGAAGANLDTTYYDADATHPNTTGHGLLAGLIQPVVAAQLAA